MSVNDSNIIFQYLIDRYNQNSDKFRRKSLIFLYSIVLLLIIGVFAVIFSRELARVDGEIAQANKSEEVSKLIKEKKKIDESNNNIIIAEDSINKLKSKNLYKSFAYGWQSYSFPKKKNRILDFESDNNKIYAVGANGLIIKIENDDYELISSPQSDYYTGASVINENLYISSLEGNIFRYNTNTGKIDLIANKSKAITSIESTSNGALIIATTLGGFYFNDRDNKTWDYIEVIKNITFNDSYYNLGKLWLVGSNGILIQYDILNRKYFQVELPTSSNLYSITGNSSSNVIAISGSDGVILISKDQGNNWEIKQSRNFTKDLYSISINDRGDFLSAVGADNSLLISNNIGDDWELEEEHGDLTTTLFSSIFADNSQSLIIGGEGNSIIFSNESHENERLDEILTGYEAEKERLTLRQKEIISEIESAQLPLQRSSDLLFHVATNTTRVAIILLIVFLVRILLNQHRYYQRLSIFYSSRSDIVKFLESLNLTPDKSQELLVLLIPDSIEMGTAPELNYSSVLDILKNLKQ